MSQHKIIEEHRQGEVYASTEMVEKEFRGKKLFLESYGCQMNFSDSEVVASILNKEGFGATRNLEEADLIFVNTCSIREKAEQTVRKRLTEFKRLKKQNKDLLIGVLGCMAERLKSKFLEEERLVDIVVGPDAYRSLPTLVSEAAGGQKAVNVLLSREETYADIAPVRLDGNGISAYVSIMRGCNNMCSFCVVPFTRGRERSRDTYSIIAEATDLYQRGFRDITLLGQNVDSYKWSSPDGAESVNFAQLLDRVAAIHPDLRIRFSTSHPKDITDEVLHTMARHENICKYIHLPVQSGNSRILQLMNRTYDREWYMNRVDAIYRILPDCAISSDMIAGFCSETEEEHEDTLSMIQYAKYSMSYMFMYSERPGTPAAKKYADDVPEEVKKRRLQEIVDAQMNMSLKVNLQDVGKVTKVLIEGDSKRSDQEFKGRTSQNKMVNFPKAGKFQPGQYVQVEITDASSGSLRGKIIHTHETVTH